MTTDGRGTVGVALALLHYGDCSADGRVEIKSLLSYCLDMIARPYGAAADGAPDELRVSA